VALALLIGGAGSVAACHVGLPGGTGNGGTTGGGPAPPLLAGPCDWRGVGQTNDVRFSPDGSTVVAAGGSFLKVFDAATGAHRSPSGWQPNALFSVTFSPDGAWMAALPAHNLYTGPASVWRTDGPQQGGALAFGHDVATAAFSPDSKLIAVLLSDGTPVVVVFRLADLSIAATLALTHNLAGLGPVLDFTADGSTLVLKDTNPYAWNTSDWTPLAGAPAIPQNPELPRTDQKSDYSAASQRQVDVNFNQVNASSVSAGSAGRYWLSPGTADLTAVAISRDGNLVAAGDAGGQVYVWQLTQAFLDQSTTDVPLLFTFSAQTSTISALALSADGTRLASASQDGTLYVWRTGDGTPLWHAAGIPIGFAGEPPKVLAADGTAGVLLVSQGGAAAYLLDATADTLRGTLLGDPSVTGCVGSPDGLATACPAGNRIQVLASGGTPTLTGSSTGTSLQRAGFALSADHTQLVEDVMALPLASLVPPSKLFLWTVGGGQSGTALAQANGAVSPLVFSKNGARVAGISSSGPVILWDAAGGGVLGQWGPASQPGFASIYEAVALSDDGMSVAAVGRATTSLLLAGPGPPREIPLSDGPDGHSSVAFSPDGTLIAATVQSLSTVPSNEIPRGGIVVRVADGTTPHSLPGVATNVAFLSNTTIVRGELDQTISYWCGP
jgi:WD40 repeat protein